MLKLRHLFWAGLAALSLTPVVAKADRAPEAYANVGGWMISYHPDTNNCSMYGSFQRGTTFFVNWRGGTYNFSIGDKAWTSIEDGERYQVTFVMDGVDRWTDVMEGHVLPDGTHTLGFNNVSQEFLLSVMRRWSISIYNTKRMNLITTLSLNNSYAAMVALVQCQAAV